jgi:hypothetical protein
MLGDLFADEGQFKPHTTYQQKHLKQPFPAPTLLVSNCLLPASVDQF